MADQLLVSRTELAHPGMPLQDAIDLVEYLADVTVGYVRFKQGVPAVAPRIDIAVVTRHRGSSGLLANTTSLATSTLPPMVPLEQTSAWERYERE
jgi:hypothetical protein